MAPALVGVALLALQEGARRGLRDTEIIAKRVLPRRSTIGTRIQATVTVEAALPLPIEVHDQVPEGLAVLSRTSKPGRGAASEFLVLRPREPGQTTWKEVVVNVSDPWGTWAIERTVHAPGALSINPEPEWEVRGRRIGKRHTIQATVPRRQAFEPTPELEAVREWQPGDRTRDIDWARTSRLQKVMTRERGRVAPRPVIILLDAGSSMRARRRTAKLTTATRVAYAVAASAQSAGVTARLITFNEQGITRAGTKGRTPEAIKGVLAGLRSVAAPETVPEIPSSADEELRLPPEERRRVLQASRALHGPLPGTPGVTEAIHRALQGTAGASFVVAIMDAEISPEAAEQAARQLTVRGHKLVVVAPATGAHHYRRSEARGAILNNLVEARKRRERLRRKLGARHVPVLSLRPDNAHEILEEVARWAQ